MGKMIKKGLSYLLTVAMVLGMFTWGPLAPDASVKEAKAAGSTTAYTKIWSGGDTTGSVVDGEEVTFTSALSGSTSFPTTSGNYYLSGDATVGERNNTIGSSQIVNLDLNGHTLTISSGNNAGIIISGGKLNIFDSSGGGKLFADRANNTKANQGGCIQISSEGECNLYSGTIKGLNATSSNANGGAVAILKGTFNMFGGSVADSNSADAGGVAVGFSSNISGYNSSCFFNMYGGTISNCTGSWGGAARVYGITKIYGGIISGCTASSGGGGIEIESGGKVYMYGGEIKNNRISGQDGDMYKGGGVHVPSGTTFSVQGNVLIHDNYEGASGTDKNNVFLRDGLKITVAGELTNEIPIGVKTQITPTVQNPITITSGNSTNNSGKTTSYVSDSSSYSFLSSGGECSLSPHLHNWTYSSSGMTITATCTTTDPNTCAYHSTGATLTLDATDMVYTGSAYDGTSVPGNLEAVTGVTATTTYFSSATEGATTGGIELENIPTDAGFYYVSVSIGGETVSKAFKITQVYTVSYDANGGSNAPAAQQKTPGEDLVLSSDVPVLAGKTFSGWATSLDGPVVYQPGGTYSNDADVTLYAKWTTVTIGNDGYPWGSNMSPSGITLRIYTIYDGDTPTYQWQSKNKNAVEYTNISGATSATYTTPTINKSSSGTWYRCVVNGSVYSKPVQAILPEMSLFSYTDTLGRTWTLPRSGNPWYLSNGTMAYTINGNVFDVVGEFHQDRKTYMLQTTYGGAGWKMYSSSSTKPGAMSYSNANAKLDEVRLSFADDRYVLNIEADLQSSEKSFSFGGDTQLGNSSTSGRYADYAALEAARNKDNTLKQIAMIGAASMAKAKDRDPAFVISSLGTKTDRDSILNRAAIPFYWLGFYSSRKPFGYHSVSKTTSQLEKGVVKATEFEKNDSVIAARTIDTGMTMSWYDVPAGNTVKFRFSVGDAESTGAITGNVDYGDETLEGLDRGVEYTITDGPTTVRFMADANGSVPLAGTYNGSPFDFFGKSITISATNYDPQTLKLAARPTALLDTVSETLASKPIEIRTQKYEIKTDSITLNLDTTDTSADGVKKLNQEYRLYDASGAEIEGCGWIMPDANGKVTFSGLTSNTNYTIKARVPASNSAPASKPPASVSVKTSKPIAFTCPETVARNTAAGITITSGEDGATVTYSTGMEVNYDNAVPTFDKGGKYKIYYRIQRANSTTLYGSYEVAVNPQVTFNANGGTLNGTATHDIVYDKTIKGSGITVSATKSDAPSTFAGWTKDPNGAELFDVNTSKVRSDITLYAKWVQSLSDFNMSLEGVTHLQLFKGNIPVSEKIAVSGGRFSFNNIPDGEYNLVIEKDGGMTITTLANVKNNAVIASPQVPGKRINTFVEVDQSTPNIVVGKLDAEAKTNASTYWDSSLIKEVPEGEQAPVFDVNLTFHVKEEENLLAVIDAAHRDYLSKADQELYDAEERIKVRAVADSANPANLQFFNMSLEKLATMTLGSDKSVMIDETLYKTGEVLELVIPYDTVTNPKPRVYRGWDDGVIGFTKLVERPTANYTDGTYWIGDGYVVAYTKKLSTFAIGNAPHPRTPEAPEAPRAAIGYGFVNYGTEVFKDTSVVDPDTYNWSDYEISTSPDFESGTICNVNDKVLSRSDSQKTYYIRVKATGDTPPSQPTPFTISRPNAPGEGMFTFTNASETGNDGSIRLNDETQAGNLQYKAPNGDWQDYPTETKGILASCSAGVYEFRYKSQPGNGILSGSSLSHEIKAETTSLESVTIDGVAKFGEILTAQIKGSYDRIPTGVKYQWYRVDIEGHETAIAGATGVRYELTAADIGYSIKVKATQTSTSTTCESSKTSLVTKADGNQKKPGLKLEDISTTATTVSIHFPTDTTDTADYEYSINGGKTWFSGTDATAHVTWDASNKTMTYSDLPSETPFKVVVREKAKEETIEGGKKVITIAPGVSSDIYTVLTDPRELAGVSLKNRSVQGGSTATVKCGQTLATELSTSDGAELSGVTYQWYRVDIEGHETAIAGETGSTYIPTGDDVGKYLRVKATKNGTTIEATTVGTVAKADGIATSDLTSNDIKPITKTSLTVNGFTDNPAKSITYEYGYRPKGSTSDYIWQDNNTINGLTPDTEYEVVVRVKGTSAREVGATSAPVDVRTKEKGIPFNEGSVDAAVVMTNYVYGSVPPDPALNVEPNDDAGEIIYYYGLSPKNVTTVWYGEAEPHYPTLLPGTYYMKAVISENSEYDEYTTKVTEFKVSKAPAVTRITITDISLDSRVVTLGNVNDDKKTYEYVILPDSGNIDDAVWRDVKFNTGSGSERTFKFIGDLNANQTYKLYVREKETVTHEASTPVVKSFTTTQFSVRYDANGGRGKVPATQISAPGTPVSVATSPEPFRQGYDFEGWAETPTATVTNKVTTDRTQTTVLYAIWGPHTYSIVFDEPGVSRKENIKYGSCFMLPTPEKAGYSFTGWAVVKGREAIYTGGQTVMNLTEEDGGQVTLYPVWTQDTKTVEGKVRSIKDGEATVRLMQGNTQWGNTLPLLMDPVSGGQYEGQFVFEKVPYGIYNLVITQVLEYEDGEGEPETITKTVRVDVTAAGVQFDEKTSVEVEALVLETKTRSKLNVEGVDTPAAVVDGLHKLADTKKTETDNVYHDITVTMTVEKHEQQALSDEATEEEINIQEDIEKIRAIEKGDTGTDESKERMFLSIGITMVKSLNGVISGDEEKITQTDNIMEIILPYDLKDVLNVFMYTCHKGEPKQLGKCGKNEKKNGCFYADPQNNRIHVYSNEFSVFAIVLDKNQVNPDPDPAPAPGPGGGGGGAGGGGGGGSSTPEGPATPAPTVSPTPTATPTATPQAVPYSTSQPSTTAAPSATTAPVNPTPTVKPADDYDPAPAPDDIDWTDPDAVAKNGKTVYDNRLSLNEGLKVSQPGSQAVVQWSSVPGANRYEIYAAYCGNKFGKKPNMVVRKAGKNKVVIKKLDGKKLKLKKNYKFFIAAYKVENGVKYKLAKSIIAHIVGRKNKKYSNPKKLTIPKKTMAMKPDKTTLLKPKVVLVNPKRKSLSDHHAPKFRYASSNRSIVSVTKKGKIKTLGKGTCYVFIYAKNGYAKKVKITVR